MKDHVFIFFVDPFFFAPPPKADSFVVAFFSLFLSSSLHVVLIFFFIRLSLSLSLTKVDDGTFIIFCGAISPRRSPLVGKRRRERKKKTAQPTEERERKKKKNGRRRNSSGCRVQHNMQSLTFTSRAVRERVFIHVAPFESENAFCVVASA
jgi:hypothetical protein